MAIKPSTKYQKSFIKLTKNNRQLGNQIITTLNTFKNNPNHPSLQLHKLKNSEVWSISVNMQIRIIFIYQNKDTILIDIGTHSIYN